MSRSWTIRMANAPECSATAVYRVLLSSCTIIFSTTYPYNIHTRKFGAVDAIDRFFDFDHELPANMESTLNLNTLANSLPNSNLAMAEKDLLNNFKGIFFHPTGFRGLTKPCRLFVFHSRRSQHHHPLPVLSTDIEACLQFRVRSRLPGYSLHDPAGCFCRWRSRGREPNVGWKDHGLGRSPVRRYQGPGGRGRRGGAERKGQRPATTPEWPKTALPNKASSE